jgi:uncharacterized protein (TIGR02271 family)
MATTVISTIDNGKIAQRLIDELVKAGLEGNDVEILAGSKDELVAEIVERGFEEGDACGYAAAVSRGRILVAARAPMDKAERAAAIMERYEGAASEDAERAEEQSVAEVEEELSVGKRKVATGGVRVTTQVSAQPVEETVTLREERVEAERKPASRTLSAEEAEAAFEEKTVEMLGTSEQAEVGKQARVVGEVAVGRQVEERQETVQDTVRRSEVEVEKVGAKSRKAR